MGSALGACRTNEGQGSNSEGRKGKFLALGVVRMLSNSQGAGPGAEGASFNSYDRLWSILQPRAAFHSPKLGRIPWDGLRAPGKGAGSEPRVGKDHSLVKCRNESKSCQVPPSSQGRCDPAEGTGPSDPG